MEEQSLIPFEGKTIRKTWHNGEWHFAVIDIIEALAATASPRQYWTKVKNNLVVESQLQPFWLQLKMKASDEKNYKTDCANTEGVLRIAMSVPSPKAEPMKLWLAQVGKERIEETENPEISIGRLTELYKTKGYDDIWIGNRLKTIGIRKELTDEWKARGVKEGQEYAILTAEIALQTFGLMPNEHAKLKGLGKENLRDHMNNLELVLTAFGEEVTRRMAIKEDAQGFNENHEAAMKGGIIAGQARMNVENQLGEKVVSSDNFLNPKIKIDETKELPTD